MFFGNINFISKRQNWVDKECIVKEGKMMPGGLSGADWSWVGGLVLVPGQAGSGPRVGSRTREESGASSGRKAGLGELDAGLALAHRTLAPSMIRLTVMITIIVIMMALSIIIFTFVLSMIRLTNPQETIRQSPLKRLRQMRKRTI